eukprot:505507_1
MDPLIETEDRIHIKAVLKNSSMHVHHADFNIDAMTNPNSHECTLRHRETQSIDETETFRNLRAAGVQRKLKNNDESCCLYGIGCCFVMLVALCMNRNRWESVIKRRMTRIYNSASSVSLFVVQKTRDCIVFWMKMQILVVLLSMIFVVIEGLVCDAIRHLALFIADFIVITDGLFGYLYSKAM